MNTLLIILAVLVIGLLFYRRPLQKKLLPKKEKYNTIDDQFNAEKKERQVEIDHLLSKIGKNGLDDLTTRQKQRLDELSKK